MKITQIDADLTQYPTLKPELLGLACTDDVQQELTLGDLSGNLLMLMWVIITAGLAEMSPQNYRALVKLQEEINTAHTASLAKDKSGRVKTIGGTPRKPGISFIDVNQVTGLTAEQQHQWETILAGTTFIHKNILLRLLGDEVAERLGTDGMMIDILEKMAGQALPFRILASNHLHFFVQYFLSKKPEEDEDDDEALDGLTANSQGVSLLHMMASINNGVVIENTVRKKVAQVYPTHLKLIDYSLGASHTDITLYAHAPFDLQSIVDVAHHYKIVVPLSFKNAQDVAKMIDLINAEFQKTYVDIYFSGKEHRPEMSHEANRYSTPHHPVGALLWLKDYRHVTLRATPTCFEKITVTLRHGHTNNPEPRIMQNRFSLNSASSQAMNAYSFPVEVVALDLDATSSHTDSPVAFTIEITSQFMPAYKRLTALRDLEPGNASPATDSHSPSPKPDTKS